MEQHDIFLTCLYTVFYKQYTQAYPHLYTLFYTKYRFLENIKDYEVKKVFNKKGRKKEILIG